MAVDAALVLAGFGLLLVLVGRNQKKYGVQAVGITLSLLSFGLLLDVHGFF